MYGLEGPLLQPIIKSTVEGQEYYVEQTLYGWRYYIR
jgi:hypothetical protein